MMTSSRLDPVRLSVQDVGRCLSRHLAMYRHKVPHYQTEMLNSLLAVWQGHHARLLDIGGGTGVVGQCMQDMFPVGQVSAVDVVDRFCQGLSIETQVYDGSHLLFDNGHFDAATINNVVHHIPVALRIPLFQEIRRAVRGPLYIKDHVAGSRLDHARLALLDFIGNIPFDGMVRADYLTPQDWEALASASGFRIAKQVSGQYRGWPMAAIFPNQLEVTMRWEAI